jgi:hypothetical protein
MNPNDLFPSILRNKENSISDVVGPEMMPSSYGYKSIDDITVFLGLYQQKMLEKVDRNEILNVGRRFVKLFLLSIVVGSAGNRILTKSKFGKFDFLNFNIFLKFFVRLSIFSISIYFFCFNPVLDYAEMVLKNLNMKYTPRMIDFKNNTDPLIMNPYLLNEPGMSEEEKEYMQVFYKNMKSQAEMMKAQKMMEERNKGRF